MRTLLGEGQLGWDSIERRQDRYGTVQLFGPDNEHIALNQESEGQYGRLVVEVVKSRKSEHCGDFARKIAPPTTPPKVGEILILGQGELFFEHYGGIHERGMMEREDDDMMGRIVDSFHSMFSEVIVERTSEEIREYDLVGLRPQIERDTDWLNPFALYRGHNQTVNLYFEPMKRPEPPIEITTEFPNAWQYTFYIRIIGIMFGLEPLIGKRLDPEKKEQDIYQRYQVTILLPQAVHGRIMEVTSGLRSYEDLNGEIVDELMNDLCLIKHGALGPR